MEMHKTLDASKDLEIASNISEDKTLDVLKHLEITGTILEDEI